jgi:hypothetical protein
MTVDVAPHASSTAPQPGYSDWPPDPYKGLNYFTAADAPLFTQRDDDIDDVAALLGNFDLQALLLHGASGTGKSSFLRAGLIPRLQNSQREFGRNFCFLREIGKDGSPGDPLLIRATDDPVARIAEALLAAANYQREMISDAARDKVLAALGGFLPQDRNKVLPSILTALQALTAPPQRDLFILVVDQAEEVLTLPPAKETHNAREAFFTLIEEICLHRLDLRAIISLRTEYYGRFCSAFRIQPTHKLTPHTEVWAGLMDYLFRPLRDRDQIAAAIRQPTLSEASLHGDGLPPPRSKYGFCYEEDLLESTGDPPEQIKVDLPEIIAADLLSQAGEASRMAAMQIVCRQLHERVVRVEKRSKITQQDYIRFGRANGVIDSFLVRAIQDAAKASGLPPLAEQGLDSWVLVLSRVVGRSEGSTVQTLIASEEDLIEEASKQNISPEVAHAMLREMVHPDRRLLRPAGGETGTPAYSLGHDSLGPALLRVRAAAGVRAAEARIRAEGEMKIARERELADRRVKDERNRSRLILAWTMVLIVGFVAAGALAATNWILPLREKVRLLTDYGTRDPTTDFRLRLLLLTAALRQSDTPLGRWVVDPEPTKAAMRQALLRAPIYGGRFTAAAEDAQDHRIVLLSNDRLFTRDLDSGKDSRPFILPPIADDLPTGARISVGSTILQDGSDALVAYRSNGASLLTGTTERSGLIASAIRFPDSFVKRNMFATRADISGGRIRLIGLQWEQGAVKEMGAFQILDNLGPEIATENPDKYLLDWERTARRANRLPVLADDCNDYAVLGQSPPSPPLQQRGLTLWLGRSGEDAHPTVLPAVPRSLEQAARSTVAFARGCGAALVLDGPNELEVINLNQKQLRADGQPMLFAVPQPLSGFVSPSSMQASALLAGTRMDNGRTWRVMWLTARGLAVMDVAGAGGGRAAPSDTSLDPMLTGLDTHSGQGQLKVSRDGQFALLVQQGLPSEGAEVRAYDLRFASRERSLDGLTSVAALVHEACRIAAYQTGDNKLDDGEMISWLGTKWAQQPCAGI